MIAGSERRVTTAASLLVVTRRAINQPTGRLARQSDASTRQSCPLVCVILSRAAGAYHVGHHKTELDLVEYMRWESGLVNKVARQRRGRK